MDYMFGCGGKIKIKNIDYSTTAKLIYIDVVVILGENIDVSMIESDDMVTELIKESMEYISPEEKMAITVSYDV